MATREILIECFKLRERVDPDRVPRVAAVMRMARECGAKFRNEQAAGWLAPFIKTAKTRIGKNSPRKRENLSPGANGEKSGRVPGAPEPNAGSAPNSPAEHENLSRNSPGENPGRVPGAPSRARDKVLLLSNSDVPHGTSDEPPRRLAAVRKQIRLDTRTEAERTADEALVELRPLVGPTLVGITWSAWRRRNRKCVVEMAASGMAADSIAAVWQRESDALGEPIRSIALLQARLNAPTNGFHRSGRRRPLSDAQLDLAKRYNEDELDLCAAEAQRDFLERYADLKTANSAPAASRSPESDRPAVEEARVVQPQDKDAEADARIALLSESDRSWLAERARVEPGVEYARRNFKSSSMVEQIIRTTERRIVLAAFDEHGKRREPAA